MTREEIKNTPEIVDFMLDKSVIADSRMKLHKRLEELCELAIKALEQQPKIGRCKDCRQWKDSDGVYRRGVGAESQCPINCREVYEGNGYCFVYAPQEKGKQAESEK